MDGLRVAVAFAWRRRTISQAIAAAAGRLALGRSTGRRELAGLRATLLALPAVRQALPSDRCALLEMLAEGLSTPPDIAALLAAAIAEEPAALVRDGGVIAAGHDPLLDELRGIGRGSDAFLVELEARERERSGIPSLRVQFNYIDGYIDQRGAAIFGPNFGALAGGSVTGGKEIGAFKTMDATLRIALPTGSTVSLSALNIFDRAPPFARLDQNYDPFTASPLGFTAKLGLSQKF